MTGWLLSLAAVAGDWGPDLIEFDLDGREKAEVMLWMSGWSYSTTEYLHASRCLGPYSYVEPDELIVALNQRFAGKRIDLDEATEELGRYVRSAYPCDIFNRAESGAQIKAR